MQPDSAAPTYRGSGVIGGRPVPLGQRLFPLRHSNRGEWFAIVLAASALLVLLVAAIRAHEHDRGTAVSYRFRSYALFLADSTAAAGLGPMVAPVRFPTTGTASRSDNALAVRIGARMADLNVLAYARGNKSVAAYYRRDTSAIPFAAEQDRLAADVAHSLSVDAELLPEGREAAWFFRASEAEATYAARLQDLTPSTRAALLRLDWLLRNEPATHFRLIARQSTELLATLGN